MTYAIVLPIVVNEDGSIDVYPSIKDVCDDLEAIDVRAGAYEAYDAAGRRLELETEGSRVLLWVSEDETDYREFLSNLVRAYVVRVGKIKLPNVDPERAALPQLLAALLKLG